MVVSILTTQDTYAISALTSQQRQLTWDRQILYDEVAGLSSPQYLAANSSPSRFERIAAVNQYLSRHGAEYPFKNARQLLLDHPGFEPEGFGDDR